MAKRLGILGAGRIGQVHARAIAQSRDAELAAISDPVPAAAHAMADIYGCSIRTADEIITASDIDAVIICTPTDLHANQIEQCARAGKAIFCEKPIDLDSARVRDVLDVVTAESCPLMVGFNRRFDPHFAQVRAEIEAGKIGTPEMAVIISRDPGAPPAEILTRSGGIFRDMTIHDFDMAVFLMGEMPSEVQATGSVLTDPEIARFGDFDSASIMLKMPSGSQVVISNSRRASYGYDQRIEVHGSKGMISAENQRPVSVELATSDGYLRPPLHHFFMTRYIDAYANELAHFIQHLTAGTAPQPSGRDGLNALLIADAAYLSAQTGQAVRLDNES